LANFDTYSGTITANAQTVVAECNNNSGVYIWLQGTYAGITLVFEGTADGGATWNAIGAYPVNGTGANVTTLTPATNAFVHYYAMVGAAKQFRVRSTAFTSGSMSVNLCAVTDADPVQSPAASITSPAAAADGLANPTTGQVGADTMYYNGASWDRARNNAPIAIDLTAARTTSGTGVTGTNYNASGVFIGINVTAVSGTTPTCVFKVQYSTDSGTNWVDLDATNAATASITATGQYYIKVYPGIPTVAAGSCNSPLPRTWRLAWTIGGTTPSFTFVSNAAYIL